MRYQYELRKKARIQADRYRQRRYNNNVLFIDLNLDESSESSLTDPFQSSSEEEEEMDFHLMLDLEI
jgi:hypothetical protein